MWAIKGQIKNIRLHKRLIKKGLFGQKYARRSRANKCCTACRNGNAVVVIT